MWRLNQTNTSKVKEQAGNYHIYSDDYKKPVYIGSSKNLRHRVSSYHQKDDYSVNRTKRNLRPHADKFTVSYKPIAEARRTEKREKKKSNYRFNFR